MSSTSNIYNINNPHSDRQDDPVGPKYAYPACEVAAEGICMTAD